MKYEDAEVREQKAKEACERAKKKATVKRVEARKTEPTAEEWFRSTEIGKRVNKGLDGK